MRRPTYAASTPSRRGSGALVRRKSRPDGVFAHRYAISQCDGLDLDGREIRVRADKGRVTKAAAPAKTQRNDADKVVDPTKIFVMNLSFDATEAELRAHCSSVGEVASVELLTRGKNQRPSGSAVVEYRYSEAAAAAVQALEGTELDGRDLRVRAYFSN